MWGEWWDWEEMWIQVHQAECSLFCWVFGRWVTHQRSRGRKRRHFWWKGKRWWHLWEKIRAVTMANRNKSSCKLAWDSRRSVPKNASHSFQSYWTRQVNGDKVVSAHGQVPNQEGGERKGRSAQAAKWNKRGPFSQFDLMGKFPFCTSSSEAHNSRAVVSLNQRCGLMWDALWSAADQAKHEQGVIFEQLMSLPEQIAWKQPQWLALILKPSLAQINSLELEGRRKLQIFTHLFIFRQKIKQLGAIMICPWRSSCKHVSTCKTSLHRLNWKWIWGCGCFPAEYTYLMKESYDQGEFFFFFQGEDTENHHFDENRRLYFHSKTPVEFVFL